MPILPHPKTGLDLLQRKGNVMTIEKRLQKLERELTATKRRNRWIFLGVASLVLGCLTIAATPRANPIIRANMFVLEDDNGKGRAALLMDNGAPTLALMDGNGKVRAQVFVGKDGPMLALSDKNENHQAMMTGGKDGPMLCMFDKNGKPRAILTVDKDGPSLGMGDANGKSIWKAP
jgi:hypothetical protein